MLWQKKTQKEKEKVNMKVWVMKLLSYDLAINIQKIDHILKIQLIAAKMKI